MAKKTSVIDRARAKALKAGQVAHSVGDTLVALGTPPLRIPEHVLALDPIAPDDVLVLAGGLTLLKFFGWEEVVGTDFIVRFPNPATPLTRTGETFSLKGVSVRITHKHTPNGKKARTVELNREVIISRSLLESAAQGQPGVRLIEMDGLIDAQGRIVLMGHPGIGFAFPAQDMTPPPPAKMW